MPAPYRPHQGRTPMALCLRLCWAGGKRAGSSGQRQVQLARSKGRTRGDFRRLQAVHSAGILAGEVGLVSAREEIGVETAEIAFPSETQYTKDFLNSIDVDGSSKGAHISVA